MENFKPYPKASESETLDGAKSVLTHSGDFDENHYLILDLAAVCRLGLESVACQ